VDPTESIQVKVEHRSWLRRVIRLSGAVDAVIDYNGRGMGFECVLVNGAVAAREVSEDGFHLAPLFQFCVPGGAEWVPAILEVNASFGLNGFRLRVGKRVVYSEGRFPAEWLPDRVLGPLAERNMNLPLASDAAIAPQALPVPAASPDCGSALSLPMLEVRAALIGKSWLRRVLRLTGEITATVIYDGSTFGYESVHVDGREAVRVPGSESHLVVPSLHFTLAGPDGPLPARFDVDTNLLLQLSSVRLVIGKQVVYAEGGFGSVHAPAAPHLLPTPSAPPDHTEALPLPAANRRGDLSELPLPGETQHLSRTD